MSDVGQGVAWDDLSAILAVARHGGLAAGARAHGSSAPTLGRRMRALERRLARELFVRRTHGYDLTEAGRRLRDDLEAAEATILRAVAPAVDTVPTVRIAAGTWTTLALAENLATLAGDPPDLRIAFVQGEDMLSLSRREAAIGLRAGRPTETGLAGRRLRPVAFAPYASPNAADCWIVVRGTTPSARWVAERCDDPACETSAPRLALDLALNGAGKALLPTFIGDARPLQRVGPIVEELSHEQWLVTHDDDRHLPEVRLAIDRIVKLLG